MKQHHLVTINFRGGIISPGLLYDILHAGELTGVVKVKFGLRQQLLMQVEKDDLAYLQQKLNRLNVFHETDEEAHPNIVSSYPAEEVFITNTWLSEGVYKDIFDSIDFTPKLKINVSDSNQSFTPLLTGNINWVASAVSPHFWHLFIRFPKTNTVFEFDELVYTNDVASLSKKIEELVFLHRKDFFDNPSADGALFFELLKKENYIRQPATAKVKLPAFNLPYFEGLNRYNDKYWLGIYRRDELFSIAFLKDVCQLCLQTKIGLLCSTPWKTIIIKSIEEKDKWRWNALLAKHKINVRHAANELNFQVEDNCEEGLALKNYLLKRFHKEDTRTFGICIGIKTRKKSEVFSSILVRRRPLLSFSGIELFHVYDILCAHDFNPNERTGFVFSSGNPKFLLAEQLRRAIFSFYNHRHSLYESLPEKTAMRKEPQEKTEPVEYVYQCTSCLTVYDEKCGEPSNDIPPGTSFGKLPENYVCPLCANEKKAFKKLERKELGLQTV